MRENIPTLATSVYAWTDEEPLYLEYEFENGQKEIAKPKNIRRLVLEFSAVNETTAYPTRFSVQGYEPSCGSWVDLLVVEEFVTTPPTNRYVFNFKNDYQVTAVRIKMTEGVQAGSYTLYGLRNIEFYEYLPFTTPALSTSERRIWIKVATTGNDLGLKAIKYEVGSDHVSRNEIVFLDDFSTNIVPSRSPHLSGIFNPGLASGSNSYDLADFEQDGITYHFIGSGNAQSSTSSYYLISYFTDERMDTLATPSPILCFASATANAGTAGTPARFFWFEGRLHFIAACYHIWRLDYPEMVSLREVAENLFVTCKNAPFNPRLPGKWLDYLHRIALPVIEDLVRHWAGGTGSGVGNPVSVYFYGPNGLLREHLDRESIVRKINAAMTPPLVPLVRKYQGIALVIVYAE